MRLSHSIAADRQRLGLSQADLAKRLGVSQQSVSKWEEGKSAPRPGKLKNLIGLFGKTSLTASATGNNLPASPHPGVTKEESLNPNYQTAPQAQAIEALARAATELARAAQAIAESAERLAAQSPPAHH